MLNIIVPVFEARDTLRRLLESISAAKNRDEISLVLVFDCDGLDYNDEIDYIEKIVVTNTVFLDENVGPGLARQAGINESSEKYIIFADADDYFLPGALDVLIARTKKDDFDVLYSAFRYERDGEVKVLQNNTAWLHGKIYKRKFLVKNKIHFSPYRANEDNGFNRLVLFYKPKLIFDKTIGYVYSENSSSITRRNNRAYKFASLEFLAKNYVWAVEEYLKNSQNPDYISVTEALYCLLLSMYYYYLEFYAVYDVEKLVDWSVGSYKIYDNYRTYLKDSDRLKLMDIYAKEYPLYDKIISFDDFLAKIEALK